MLYIKEMHIFKTSDCIQSILAIAIWKKKKSIGKILNVTKLDLYTSANLQKENLLATLCSASK